MLQQMEAFLATRGDEPVYTFPLTDVLRNLTQQEEEVITYTFVCVLRVLCVLGGGGINCVTKCAYTHHTHTYKNAHIHTGARTDDRGSRRAS
jgi:hypothetical protein